MTTATERKVLTGGHIPPKRVSEGAIRCACGYEGRPMPPLIRWADDVPAPLGGSWQGRCPCGSHSTITPREE